LARNARTHSTGSHDRRRRYRAGHRGAVSSVALPALADLVRPGVIAAPAVDRVIERSSLAGGLSADSRQPLPIGIPTVLLARSGATRLLRRSLLEKRRAKLAGFLLAHRLKTVRCRGVRSLSRTPVQSPGTASQTKWRNHQVLQTVRDVFT